MIASINNALSGLNAASLRLNVAANNLANQNSTQTLENGQAVAKPFQAQQVVQSALPGGGVEAKVQSAGTPDELAYDPESPDANAEGIVAKPGVDTAQELVNANLASYDFKANLKTLKVQDEMFKNALDILA